MQTIRMQTIMAVFGTRPEAVKMCPLVKELNRRPGTDVYVCVTGQHRKLLNQVLFAFDIVPDYDLEIMKPNQSAFDITEEVLHNIQQVYRDVEPDLVVVQGDTTSAFAAALAAYYLHIPVAHVEAGVRSGNLYGAYPEEFNRRTIDLISHYCFAPTKDARENLLSEGKDPEQVFVTGNTVVDAIHKTVERGYSHPGLKWAAGSRLITMTAHRKESLGAPMHNMFRAIRRVVETFEDVKIIYPVHINPQVRDAAVEELGGVDRIKLVKPLGVVDFHNVLANSYLVLTDSGGVQEEASSLHKPTLVMRNTTDRPEALEAGTVRLVGTSEGSIFDACFELLTNENAYKRMAQAPNPYGDGRACQRIADVLCGK